MTTPSQLHAPQQFLSQEKILKLYERLIDSDLKVEGLLARLAPDVCALLERAGSNRAETLLLILSGLNRLRLVDGSIPLRTVLENAAALLGPAAARSFFEETLASLNAAFPEAAPPPAGSSAPVVSRAAPARARSAKRLLLLLALTNLATLLIALGPLRWLLPSRSINVARYPGYHHSDLSSKSGIVPLEINRYDELTKRVEKNPESIDVLILSSGIYAELLSDSDASNIGMFQCYLDPNEVGDPSRGSYYQPVILVNPSCDLYAQLSGAEGSPFEIISQHVAESANAAKFVESLYIADLKSSSAFYAPLRALGLYNNFTDFNCTGDHFTAIERLNSPTCAIVATSRDELAVALDKKVVRSAGYRLVALPPEYNIPSSPYCIRKRYLGTPAHMGDAAILKSYFGFHKDPEQVDDDFYKRFFDSVIVPVRSSGKAYRCREPGSVDQRHRL